MTTENNGDKKAKGKSWKISLTEIPQWIGIFYAIFSDRQHSQPGEKGSEGKEDESWLFKIAPSLSRRDEELFIQAMDSHPDRVKLREEEFKFRTKIGVDGFSVIAYIMYIASMRQEFLKLIQNPAPENKGADRLSYQKLEVRDSCLEFFDDLLLAASKGNTPEEIYKLQRQAADSRKLLVKKGIIEKFREHKLLTLLLLLCTVISTVSLAFWIVRKIITRIIFG